MREDDRQKKALLLLEYREAMQHLETLHQRASSIHRALHDLALWVKAFGTSSLDLPSRKYLDRPIDLDFKKNVQPLKEPFYRDVMNFEELGKLLHEIIAEEEHIEELRDQQRELGL